MDALSVLSGWSGLAEWVLSGRGVRYTGGRSGVGGFSGGGCRGDGVGVGAVNAAMMPLDRAARLFLDQTSPAWRIALAEHARGRVDAYQRRATRVETGSDGYPTSRGYPYVGARQTLDAVLAAQTGGHPPGQIVHLPNGQACVVKAAQWWDDDDGPAGYVLLPLLPPGELRTELEVRADTVTADEP